MFRVKIQPINYFVNLVKKCFVWILSLHKPNRYMCTIKHTVLSLIIKSFQQMSVNRWVEWKNRTVRKGEEYCFYTKSCSISQFNLLAYSVFMYNFFLSYVPTYIYNLHIIQSSVRFLRGKISTSSLNFRARVKQIYIQILTFRFLILFFFKTTDFKTILKLFCCVFLKAH